MSSIEDKTWINSVKYDGNNLPPMAGTIKELLEEFGILGLTVWNPNDYDEGDGWQDKFESKLHWAKKMLQVVEGAVDENGQVIDGAYPRCLRQGRQWEIKEAEELDCEVIRIDVAANGCAASKIEKERKAGHKYRWAARNAERELEAALDRFAFEDDEELRKKERNIKEN